MFNVAGGLFPMNYPVNLFPLAVNPFDPRNPNPVRPKVHRNQETFRFKLYESEENFYSDVIRLIFSFAQVPLKEKRLKADELEKLKENSPFDAAPILRVDKNEKIFQFDPILRFIGEKFFLYGANKKEKVLVDMLVESLREIDRQILDKNRLFGKDKENFRKWLENEGAQNLVKLNKILTSFKVRGAFSLGNFVSVVDFWIYKLIGLLFENEPKIFDKFPQFKFARDRFEKHPQIIRCQKTKVNKPTTNFNVRNVENLTEARLRKYSARKTNKDTKSKTKT